MLEEFDEVIKEQSIYALPKFPHPDSFDLGSFRSTLHENDPGTARVVSVRNGSINLSEWNKSKKLDSKNFIKKKESIKFTKEKKNLELFGKIKMRRKLSGILETEDRIKRNQIDIKKNFGIGFVSRNRKIKFEKFFKNLKGDLKKKYVLGKKIELRKIFEIEKEGLISLKRIKRKKFFCKAPEVDLKVLIYPKRKNGRQNMARRTFMG